MSAGTVVITGGILAAVILLCIVAVLCYCRLQYYCCRRGDSELDVGSMEGGEPFHGHYACNACSALAMDGTLVPSLYLDRLEELELPQEEEEEEEASARPLPLPAPPGHGGRCPSCASCSCSSSARPFNGGERLGFHTYYDNPSAPLLLSATASPLSYYGNADLFPAPPRPYSTPV